MCPAMGVVDRWSFTTEPGLSVVWHLRKMGMNDLLIIQNISREGPGLLEQMLKDENIAFDVVCLDKGQEIPALDDYKALVVLGGPDSANDDTTEMAKELARIKEWINSGRPYLGICLGLQMLVKSAGGKVVKSEIKEVGFMDPDNNQFTVNVTDEGKTDKLLVGLPEVLHVFQLHGETVELTNDMTILATGKFCRNQIVKVAQKAYGLQSHFEITPEMLAIWAEQDPDLMLIDKDKLLADFKAIEQSYTNIGETLFRNFLEIVDNNLGLSREYVGAKLREAEEEMAKQSCEDFSVTPGLQFKNEDCLFS
jgi:GMP synthase-like glutamine amidotransferase